MKHTDGEQNVCFSGSPGVEFLRFHCQTCFKKTFVSSSDQTHRSMTQGSFASPNITSCQLIPFPLSTSVRPHPQHTLSCILMASRSSDLTHCVRPPPCLSHFFLLHISLSFTPRPPSKLHTCMQTLQCMHTHCQQMQRHALMSSLHSLHTHTQSTRQYAHSPLRVTGFIGGEGQETIGHIIFSTKVVIITYFGGETFKCVLYPLKTFKDREQIQQHMWNLCERLFT